MKFRPSALLVALLFAAAGIAAISPARAAGPDFPDVPSHHPYAFAIQDLATRQIINGFADGSFQPDRPVTRQQFTKMVLLSLGVPVSEDDWPSRDVPFVDLGPDDPGSLYPHEYVAKAAVHHITNGKDATHFAPGDNISRAQVITMVVRAAQNLYPDTVSLPAGPTDSPWGDFDPIHAQNAAVALVNGMLTGLGADPSHPSGNLAALDPFGRMSRGEVAQVLHNLLELIMQTATPASSMPSSTSPGSTSPTSSSTTTSSTTTSSTTSTTAAALGDLMHFSWTAADGWEVENVSTLTGVKVAGQPVQVPKIPGYGAAILARGADGRLLALAYEPPPWWQKVTPGLPAPQIAGPLTTWRTSDYCALTRSYIHVAGPSVSGDLLHFWWGEEKGVQLPWAFENVSTLTGQKIQGEVSSWVTRWGPDDEAEHVTTRSPDDDLLVFWDVAPLHNWKVVNVSSLTGKKIAGAPTSWTKSLGGALSEDHIAAMGQDGHLLHFYWTAAYGWKVEDVSGPLGAPALVGSITWWGEHILGKPGFDNLTAVGTSGDLLNFWRLDGGLGWQLENVAGPTEHMALGPTAYYTDQNLDGTEYDHIVAEGSNGHLFVFWTERLKHEWRRTDVTAFSGDRMQGPFAVWAWYSMNSIVGDHLVGVKR